MAKFVSRAASSIKDLAMTVGVSSSSSEEEELREEVAEVVGELGRSSWPAASWPVEPDPCCLRWRYSEIDSCKQIYMLQQIFFMKWKENIF